jgi:hypothetical protein
VSETEVIFHFSEEIAWSNRDLYINKNNRYYPIVIADLGIILLTVKYIQKRKVKKHEIQNISDGAEEKNCHRGT